MKNRQDIPWPRIFAEGVAIVISILLAFAIDAWWQAQRDGQRERETLLALLDDFETTKSNIHNAQEFHRAIQQNTINLLKAVTESNPSLSNDEIEQLVVGITWWDGWSHFPTGAVNSVVFGGDLAILTDDVLRKLVADWPSKIDRFEKAQRQDYDFFFNVLMPFLRGNSYLPQQATVVASIPGGADIPPFAIDLEIKDVRTYEEIMANEEFHNILAHKSWIQSDILIVLDEAEALIDQMMEHIQRGL